MTSNLDNLTQKMMGWRHDFHRHPELGFEVTDTAAKIAAILRPLGFEVAEGIGRTGIVAVLKKGSSDRMIGIRADMDALAIQEQNDFDHKSTIDGRMHACGHDGHSAILLGAAHLLAEETDFDGSVALIFQPDEEHGKGALAMIDDGLFDRFPMQAIYALHNMPSLETGHVAVTNGPIMASEDNFTITVKGKGGHAALPHLSRDPIPVAAQIALALQTLVSRRIKPTDCAVVSVTDITTDGTRNVIPNQVTLTGDTRSFTPEVQAQLESGMEELVSGICAAHGVGYEFHHSHEFASTINTTDESRHVAEAATSLLGAERVNDQASPIMASEDFGFMLQKKPGCYFLLGNGGTGPGGCGLHSPIYDFNDDILLTGAQLWQQLVQQQLAC